MADFFEGIEILSDTISRINEANEEIINAENLFSNSQFLIDMETIGLDSSMFKIEGSVGDYYLTNEGLRIDIKDAAEKMNNGDLLGALNNLGISVEDFDQSIRDYASRYKQAWDQQIGIQDIISQEDYNNAGIDLENNVGTPTNVELFESILNENTALKSEFDTQINELKKKIDDSYAKGNQGRVEVGKWIKRTIIFTGVTIGLVEIYKLIRDHQRALNGCWLIKASNGQKCKVKTLTCFDENTMQCSNEALNQCGPQKINPCFSTDTCIKYEGNNCVTTLGQCSEGICNKLYCDNSKIETPPGYKLVCINVNFWTAAFDFFDTIFTTERFLLYIIIGIAIILLLFFIFFRRK